MTIESALYDKISGTTAITDLVGTRIYPELAPAGVARPYLTYQVISTTRSRHFTGVTGSQVDFVRVDVNVWADTSLSRRNVVEAVRDALDGFRGAMGTEALDVRRVEVGGPSMSSINPEAADETPLYRAILDVEIYHR